MGAAHDDTPSLKNRHNLIKNNKNGTFKILNRSSKIRADHKKLLEDHTEEFIWTIESSSTKDPLGNNYKERHKLSDDRGSAWLSFICSVATKENNAKIYLSGHGVDEIFSDYGFNGKKYTKHSNFGGLFPKDLKIFSFWDCTFHKGKWTGDDIAFCNLATDNGFKLYANIESTMIHHGSMGYKGRYGDGLMSKNEK